MHMVRTKNFVRISKRVAKRLFFENQPIYLCASKQNPESVWGGAHKVQKENDDHTFDQYKNEFAYYNCDNERGKEIYYYAKMI